MHTSPPAGSHGYFTRRAEANANRSATSSADASLLLGASGDFVRDCLSLQQQRLNENGFDESSLMMGDPNGGVSSSGLIDSQNSSGLIGSGGSGVVGSTAYMLFDGYNDPPPSSGSRVQRQGNMFDEDVEGLGMVSSSDGHMAKVNGSSSGPSSSSGGGRGMPSRSTLMRAERFLMILKQEIDFTNESLMDELNILPSLRTEDGLHLFCLEMVAALDIFCCNMSPVLQKQKHLELIQNLKRHNNRELRLKILTGEMTINQLIEADAKDLAPESLKRKRDAESEKYFNEQVLLRTASVIPVVRKTHKGLEPVEDTLIDGSTNNPNSSTPLTGTTPRKTSLSGTGGSSTSPSYPNGRHSPNEEGGGGGFGFSSGGDNPPPSPVRDHISVAEIFQDRVKGPWTNTRNTSITPNASSNTNEDETATPNAEDDDSSSLDSLGIGPSTSNLFADTLLMNIKFPRWNHLIQKPLMDKLSLKPKDMPPDTSCISIKWMAERLNARIDTLEAAGCPVEGLRSQINSHSCTLSDSFNVSLKAMYGMK